MFMFSKPVNLRNTRLPGVPTGPLDSCPTGGRRGAVAVDSTLAAELLLKADAGQRLPPLSCVFLIANIPEFDETPVFGLCAGSRRQTKHEQQAGSSSIQHNPEGSVAHGFANYSPPYKLQLSKS